MDSLKVKLPQNSYDIKWEKDFERFKLNLLEYHTGHKNFIFTNETIFEYYERQLREIFPDDKIFILKDSEEEKNMGTIEEYGNQLLSHGANRTSTLWAFGGGVIGDITGFLASIFMRGVDYYQIPTTLLSMVDSSVGGKTGVNVKAGKNMLGTFYQPRGVFIHTPFLKTLPEKEYKCGLSEVIKSALLDDPDLFEYIKSHAGKLSPQSIESNEIISQKSVQVKADVVIKDEKESNLRAILNLGHTLAHALESHYKYTGISHGEAVSVGISFASRLAGDLNILSPKIIEEVDKLFEDLSIMHKWSDLPDPIPDLDEIIELMKGDKKNTDNQIRFVFFSDIGKFLLPRAVEIPKIKACLEKFK